MIDICPTIDAETPEAYRQQMGRIAGFAQRIHIDLGDGVFTPNTLVPVDEIWWPGGIWADLHVMFERPFEHLEALVALKPQLIIVQAEAEGDFPAFVDMVHRHGIEAGVALLQQTDVETIKPALEFIDHVLVFSGNLGRQGGSEANLGLLDKVKAIKSMRSNIEVGWDGGVNDQNIKQLVDGGVDVVNVGGFIQNSNIPETTFELLLKAVEKS